MRAINTSFTKLMNIRTPIVAAPMYTATTPELVAAVTKAGGFGFLAAGPETPEQVKQLVQTARSHLNAPPGAQVQIGTGFLGWSLDKYEAVPNPCISAFLDEHPAAIWFAFGNDLGKYIQQVRDYQMDKPHKTKVFVIVNSLAETLKAAHEWKADVLVVQGTESGGHGAATAPSLFILLQAVISALPNGPPILAAGGISTGSQIAALLTLGASGVVIGTRYLLTPECSYPQSMKNVILKSEIESTIRSFAFDEVFPIPTSWPENIDGRCVINNVWKDAQAGLSIEERKKRIQEGKERGDEDYLFVWAGAGAGLVKEIVGAEELTIELHNDTVKTLEDRQSLLA